MATRKSRPHVYSDGSYQENQTTHDRGLGKNCLYVATIPELNAASQAEWNIYSTSSNSDPKNTQRAIYRQKTAPRTKGCNYCGHTEN